MSAKSGSRLSSHVKVMTSGRDSEREQIHRWLSAPDPSSIHIEACIKRQSGTGLWFLNSKEFHDWTKNSNSFLWLYGIPGCGKTILSSTIVEEITLRLTLHNNLSHVAYFYFAANDPKMQRHQGMVRSLITQIFVQHEITPRVLKRLYRSCMNGERQPKHNELMTTLQRLIQDSAQTFIILDALDECTEREEVLSDIKQIAEWKTGNLHILVTSRRESDIEEWFQSLLSEAGRVCIGGPMVDDDVRKYVRERLQRDGKLRRWQGYPQVQEEIEMNLVKNASGMFRWAVCQLDALQKCRNRTSLHESLTTLPKGLDATYGLMIRNIDEEDIQNAIRILQWLACSATPLSVWELAEVLIVDVNANPQVDLELRFLDPKEVLEICSGFVTFSTDLTEVRLAHFSTREYLFSEEIKAGPVSQFYMTETEVNVSMAKSCVAYLVQFNTPNSLTRGTLNQFPLARYAAKYWTQHARADTRNDTKLLELIMELFQSRGDAYYNWIRIYDPDQGKEDEPNLTRDLEVAQPLYYASLEGLPEPVRLMLENGADVNAQGGTYGSALQAAALHDHRDVVQQLLDAGAEVNARGGPHGNPLQAAVLSHHLKTVRLLLEKGADINAQSGEYGNALQAAVLCNYTDMVQLLLDKGADINAQGGKYGNALQVALLCNHGAIVELLLERGADDTALKGEDPDNATKAPGGIMPNIIPELKALDISKDTSATKPNSVVTSANIEQVETKEDEASYHTSVIYPEDPMSAIENALVTIGEETLERNKLTVVLWWDVTAFLEADGSPSRRDLKDMLALSGTETCACARPLHEYISQTWKKTGAALFNLCYLDAIYDHSSIFHTGRLTVNISVDQARHGDRRHDRATVNIEGSPETILEVAQQLAWIAATLTPGKPGVLTRSMIGFRIRGLEPHEKSWEKRMSKSPILELELKREQVDIGASSSDPQYDLGSSKGICWQPLFLGGILAYKFPTELSSSQGAGPDRQLAGLDIPYEWMALLAGIEFESKHEGGWILHGSRRETSIKGAIEQAELPTSNQSWYPTILFPSRTCNNSVIWHYFSGKPGESRSFLQAAVKGDMIYQSPDLDTLRAAMTLYLGYSSHTKVYLGTGAGGAGGMANTFHGSNIPPDESHFKLAQVTPTVGFSRIATASVAGNFVLQPGMAANQEDMYGRYSHNLTERKKWPLLCYDVLEKRGWLVSELSMVLHLARSLATIANNPPNTIPYADPSSDGGDAAATAMVNFGNCDIRRQVYNQGIQTEKFSDLINACLGAFDALRQAVNDNNARVPTSQVFVWDYLDLVTLQTIEVRARIIDTEDIDWWDIVKRDRRILVIVGNTMGELIQPDVTEPTCSKWQGVPRGVNYLTATVPCLLDLSQRVQGSPNNVNFCSQLAQNLWWERPRNSALFQDCRQQGCEMVQKLRNKSPKPEREPPANLRRDHFNGAVIFAAKESALEKFRKKLGYRSHTPCRQTQGREGFENRSFTRPGEEQVGEMENGLIDLDSDITDD